MKPILPLMLVFPVLALACEGNFTLVIQDHHFQPETLTIPAGKKVCLIVENRDGSQEEFDSYALAREKVIPGNDKRTIYIGPLDPGTYPFIGDFHKDSAKGTVIAK